MKYLPLAISAILLVPSLSWAEESAKHPDLSGIWAYVVDLPRNGLKKEADGKVAIAVVERGVSASEAAKIKGALPSTPRPSYKPELQAKVKDFFENENRLDPVFYCGKPGVPRIGTPRKIIQTPREIVFFYEDISGDPYRIIPIVESKAAVKHRENANPSYYGDSVAYWEGGTLVVDVTNFVDDSWFGEGGYFHTDALHVTERLWKDGSNLAYQAIVDEPKVLTAPWVMPTRVVKPSLEPLEESPRCVEDDGPRLLNKDHHGQR